MPGQTNLIDAFGRSVHYLRVSVTDRCDLRCVYCMGERPTFLPRKELLSLEELDRVCSVFIEKGVHKIRITGGEPLIRRDIMTLFRRLSRHLHTGKLKELVVTTNGTQLTRFASELVECGVKRINISLDTLDERKFRSLTRLGSMEPVLAGIAAAQKAGLKIKLNTVVLKDFNDKEISAILEWANDQGMDLTLIEVMPMGETGEDRFDQYYPLSVMREKLEQKYTLQPLNESTGGPASYVRVKETGGKLGFITPLSHNFCESCNRVRLTCTGQLYLCLGREDVADLRTALRQSDTNEGLIEAIDQAVSRKPKGHDFVIERREQVAAIQRSMSVTGG